MNNDDHRLNPGVTFSFKRRRTLIYRATIRALGNPNHIRFLYNARGGRFAIQSCEAIDHDSFKVPDLATSQLTFEITSMNFMKIIYKACDWTEDQNYRIEGVLHSDYHLVEFDLKEAVVVGNEFVDPELYSES